MAYQIGTTVLLILFYGIYYGKKYIQKKSGIRTNQIMRQQGTAYTVGILMIIATGMAPLGEILAIVQGRPFFPEAVRIMGLGIMAFGNIVFFLSVRTMGNSWRAGVSSTEKTSLITRGVYSISRNPAFLGFDLVYLGCLLIFYSWWLCVVSLFAVLMLHLQIVLVEEPYLPKAFGEDYYVYQHQVCRYIGRKSTIRHER